MYYASLDELEEARLLAFRSVLKVLHVILAQATKKQNWFWPNQQEREDKSGIRKSKMKP
jgi:hypothetical protein